MGRTVAAVLLAALAAAAVPAAPAAADFQGGLKAYERGDYGAALAAWRPLAEAGNARVQQIIASLYAGAEGVEKDDVEAFVWLSLAVHNYRPGSDRMRAERTLANLGRRLTADELRLAQLRLGHRFEEGRGAAADPLAATRWYRKAAEAGSTAAADRIVALYAQGLGIPEDAREALWWHRLAAARGLAKAQYTLGTLYELGKGVRRDYGKAAAWYRKAAEQGYADALFNLGFLYVQGQGVPRDEARAYMFFALAAEAYPPGKVRDSAIRNRDAVAQTLGEKRLKEARRLADDWRARHKKKAR